MKKVIAVFFRAVDIVSIFCLVILVLLVFAQVVFRYAGIPSPWTEELARFAFVYITFLGSILALKNGTHIEIDVLLSRMPARLRHGVRAVTHMLIAAFLFLFIRGTLLTIQTSGSVRSSSLLWFEMNYIYFVVLAAGASMLGVSMAQVVREVQGLLSCTRRESQAQEGQA